MVATRIGVSPSFQLSLESRNILVDAVGFIRVIWILAFVRMTANHA